MTEDSRKSNHPESGTATFSDGDSGSSKDLITIRDSQTFSPHDYVVSYSDSGSEEATVKFYDDDEGTDADEVEGEFERVHVQPGDVVDVNGISRDDITNDVVAVVEDNDGDVTVTIGGHVLTG